MSLNLYQQLLEKITKQDVVLATVVEIQGSVPREIGAKMIICENGDIISTIGGGAGEAKVCQKAQEILKTGEKQWVNIDLSGATHKQIEGVCGGLMKVWLEKWTGEKAIALVKKIINYLELGKNITLFTPFSSSQIPYIIDDNYPQPSPELGFSEVLQPPLTLLIIGAGHVGVQLAKVADMLGFQIAIQDDRPEWANSQLYPQANYISTQPMSEVLSRFQDNQNLYIAMVTRGYQFDLDALLPILESKINYRYLGMIGSKKRIKMVHKAINSQYPTLDLSSIYAPIGLDIGALTPQEIAVSIGAELLLVQRGGTGKPLSTLPKYLN